ncbi:MAG: NAD(P)H-dependent oxidoreductase [Planctomycetota bacterium]|jgi:chromate reductase|nr:NAD(P)H-dependent oxidoreductase [Planctomycetota bacterium]
MKIAVIPGTNRAGALSQRLGEVVAACYAELGHEVDLFDLKTMGPEFLEPTAYKEQPPAVTALVERFVAADGVHFIVPEYNGSFPGVVKLLIDMLPYPAGLDKRPCAYIGLAAGQFQGLRAVEALQGVTGYRMAYQYPRRVFIGNSFKQFDEAGLSDEDLASRVTAQCVGFAEFITEVGGKAAKTLE